MHFSTKPFIAMTCIIIITIYIHYGNPQGWIQDFRKGFRVTAKYLNVAHSFVGHILRFYHSPISRKPGNLSSCKHEQHES